MKRVPPKLSKPVRDELFATLNLAAPLALAQLGFIAMGFVDLMMVGGLGDGRTEVGGVGIAAALFFTPALALSAVLMSLDSLVGGRVGAGEHKECGALLWQGYWLAFFLALSATPMFFFGEDLALLLGQSEAVSSECGRYLQARGWSLFPFLLFCTQRGFLSGIGDTRPILYTVLVVNLINAAADWLLIYGNLGAPALGTAGAGYASTISTLCMCLILGYWVHVAPRGQEFRVGPQGPNRRRLWGILSFGGPFGLHLLVEVGSFNIVAFLAGILSDAELAAHQIAIHLSSVTYMVPCGISLAASVRVAQKLGEKDREGALRAGRIALVIGAVFMSLCCLGFLLFRHQLVALFNVKDQEVLRHGASLMVVAAFFQVSDALQVIGAGCFRGAGDTKSPLWANLIGHWVCALPVGVLLAFPLGWGVRGLWMGLLIGLSLVGIYLCARFWRGTWSPDAMGGERERAR